MTGRDLRAMRKRAEEPKYGPCIYPVIVRREPFKDPLTGYAGNRREPLVTLPLLSGIPPDSPTTTASGATDMRVLVTGAGGFVGTAFFIKVCEPGPWRDRTEGWTFTGTALRQNPGDIPAFNYQPVAEAVASGRVRFCTAKPSHVLVNGQHDGGRYDAVVNLAAKTVSDYRDKSFWPYYHANVTYVAELIQACHDAGCTRILHLSSDEVYGPSRCDPNDCGHDESAPLRPQSVYATTKAAGDVLVLGHAARGCNATVVRTQNLYGYHQRACKVIPTFVRKALAGEPLPIYGDGLNTRRWLWVDDLIDALLMLLPQEHPGKVLHVASQSEVTTLSLARMVLEALNLPRDRIQYVQEKELRPQHQKRMALDSRLVRAFGWKDHVPPSTGVPWAARWYAANGARA